MLPSRYRAFERKLAPPFDALYRALSAYIPADRLITDPLRLLTWGTDASFYRLVPRIVVVDSEDEVVRLLADCAGLGTPVTFRAAGTSLSGQAISDSVLMLLGDGWRRVEIGPAAETVTLQPGVVGAAANRRLARFGRKIGPDPASIACEIGLSEYSGFPYRSIIRLVDACATARHPCPARDAATRDQQPLPSAGHPR